MRTERLLLAVTLAGASALLACKRDGDASAAVDAPLRSAPLQAESAAQQELVDQLEFSAALVRGTTIAGTLDPLLGVRGGAAEDALAREIYLVASVRPRTGLDKRIVDLVVEFVEPERLKGRKVDVGGGLMEEGSLYVVRKVVAADEELGSGKGIQDGRAPIVASNARFKVVKLGVK